MPLIAATPWRRTLPTFLRPETDLDTRAPFYINGVEQAGGTAVVAPWVATPEAANPALYGEQNAGSGVPPIVDERGIATDSSDSELFQAALVTDSFLANRHTVTSRVLGVQWHPERLTANGHHVLFDWLVREAGR